MTETTRLLRSGRSQAVRLPKASRVEGDEVRVRGQGRGVVLEPIAEDWAWLDAIAGTFSDDFFAEGRRQPDQQRRTELDRLLD